MVWQGARSQPARVILLLGASMRWTLESNCRKRKKVKLTDDLRVVGEADGTTQERLRGNTPKNFSIGK